MEQVSDTPMDEEKSNDKYENVSPNKNRTNKAETDDTVTASETLLTRNMELDSIQNDCDNSSTESQNMTSEQKFTLVSLCVSYIFEAAFFSMLGPFFPQEANKKGASETMTGLIFGIFAVVMFLTSPFFGAILTRVGAKFMFVAGLFVAGGCNVIFGFLDESPNGWIYVVLCLTVRTLEALGTSAYATASFAIMAYTFPDRVSTMFGIIEVFGGLGMMIGPVIGGALFQAGGFKLPFVVSGALVTFIAILCIWLLPSPKNLENMQGSILSLFKMPITFLVYYIIFVGALTIGFLDVAYSLHLKPFHLSPLLVGIVFLVGPAVYALASPFLGCILDKKGWCKSSMALGGILVLVSFSLMGPVPFLSLPIESLWLNIVSSVMLGLGFSTLLVPPLQELLIAAFKSGYPDNLETYGITSGLYTSAFSAGGLGGSIGGGFLLEKVGFSWTAFIMGLMGASCTLFLALYQFVRTFRCKSKEEIPERSPLIP
ncbi:unnamed protein product [Owenia fusiformis]|uniref:Major facilitator superfamily (MFS) profile domain-containing protein n=1 Tax=Owenia fusiformis TaxID=6347 RepID=A0A8S4N201_OWEFU|nr:unnamed protein product [Owenia fusiformis]